MSTRAHDHWAALRATLAPLPTPLGFVDLDALDANARALLVRADRTPIRVASKSVRCVPLLQRVLACDERYRGVLCAGAGEAVALAARGLRDLLVAYPCVEQERLREVAQSVSDGAEITLMVDDPAHLERAQVAAATHGVVLPVCLDLDVSQHYGSSRHGLRFGTYRSPIRSAADALALAERITAHPNLRLRGLMAYEGQLAGLGDAGAGPRAQLIRQLQRRARAEVAARRAEVVAALQTAGHDLEFVNAGGTGSLESSAAEDVVTEVAAGSGLFAPALFDGYQGFQHVPAVGFALRVTRRPEPGVVTCAGGGLIASGPAGADRLPVPTSPPGLRYVATEGPGEVQTPLREPADVRLSIGDLVLFRHAKAGELCEHVDELVAVQAGRVVDRLPTYRADGIRIP